MGTANAAHSNAVAISRGLVGYWTFDGSATNWRANTTADLSGNGSTGRLVSMSTTTSPTAGIVGQALRFDGTNDGVEANVGYLLSFSMAFWFKNVDDPNKVLVDTNGYLYCSLDWAPAGSLRCGNGATYVATSFAVNDGKWHHAVYTVSTSTSPAMGPAMQRLYLDGSLVDSDASDPHVGNGVDGSILIRARTWNDFYLNGSMDDVRIYNRVLSATEAKQLYNSGAANVGHSNTVALSNGLVGYWTFDGSATNWRTNTTADLSGNGNFGKLSTLSTSTTPVAGKIGQAFTFSGSQAVRIEDSPSLDVGDIVSYSMWIKRARTGALEVFFAKDTNTAVGVFQSNNRVALHMSFPK